MKKLTFITALLFFIPFITNAQKIFIAGSGHYGFDEDNSATTIRYEKETSYAYDLSVGYFLDSNWAVGIASARLVNLRTRFNEVRFNPPMNDTFDLTSKSKVSLLGISVRRYWNISERLRSFVHLRYMRGQGYTQEEQYDRFAPDRKKIEPYSSRDEQGDLSAGLTFFLTKHAAIEITMPLGVWQKRITRINMPSKYTYKNFATFLNEGISLNSLSIGLAAYF